MINVQIRWLIARIIGVVLCWVIASPALAEQSIAKLTYLVVDNDKLIAANIKRNRFDELRLEARETLLDKAEANAVIVIVTNRRIIGYSVFTASWKTIDLKAEEDVTGIKAADYSALIQTNKRFISFNGETGAWAETKRSRVFD